MGRMSSHPKGSCRKEHGEGWWQFTSSSMCCCQSHGQWLRIHNQLATPNYSPWGSLRDLWNRSQGWFSTHIASKADWLWHTPRSPPSQAARMFTSEKTEKLNISKSADEKYSGTTMVTSKWQSFKNFVSLWLTTPLWPGWAAFKPPKTSELTWGIQAGIFPERVRKKTPACTSDDNYSLLTHPENTLVYSLFTHSFAMPDSSLFILSA